MTDSTDIARRNIVVDDESLATIDSFAAALELVRQLNTEQVADYGTGFMLLDDKNKLVGVPFVVIQWAFNEGDYGEDFVSVEIVTANPITSNGATGIKWILNDGSTGICRQLRGVTAARTKAKRSDTHAGLSVPRGLTRTDYHFNENTKETAAHAGDGDGWRPASTHYLAQ